jgi:hypothetical protein
LGPAQDFDLADVVEFLFEEMIADNGISLNATATAGSVVTEIAWVPMPRIWML